MPSLLDDSAAEAVVMMSAATAVVESNVDPCVDVVTLLAGLVVCCVSVPMSG